MLVPVSAIFEGQTVRMHDVVLAKEQGGASILGNNLFVHASHGGAPTAAELINSAEEFYLGTPAAEGHEETGHTLIVNRSGDSKGIVLYFQSDQLEIFAVDEAHEFSEQ